MQAHNDPLGDQHHAAHAWARFRRILRWMGLAALVAVLAALWALDHWFGPLHWVTVLATIAGVGGSVMLTAALMGLVFMSSGTGHDAAVDRRD